jgi:hypothetical protein
MGRWVSVVLSENRRYMGLIPNDTNFGMCMSMMGEIHACKTELEQEQRWSRMIASSNNIWSIQKDLGLIKESLCSSIQTLTTGGERLERLTEKGEELVNATDQLRRKAKERNAYCCMRLWNNVYYYSS